MATAKRRGAAFLLLIDPDRVSQEQYLELADNATECDVDAILVGTSFMLNTNFADAVRQIKQRATVPVIIFPGSFAQITPQADAILFMSLVSGRNPEYLIGEQVKGAPLVRQAGLEAIPTGYILVESGPLTSVQYISGTLPIPRTKPDIACAHALAAQYLGMQLVYLEAGSGAQQAVPLEMIRSVADYIEIPVAVGGGLRTPDDCAHSVEAGASWIVVGTQVEQDGSPALLREFTAAVHTKDLISA